MFVDDIKAEGAYLARIIRSPYPKGTILDVRCPGLEEGYSFITAKDIPGENLLFGTDMPLLASTKVSYIGEPVALLAGPDKMRVDEYAAACTVELQTHLPEDETFFTPAKWESIFSADEIAVGPLPKLPEAEQHDCIIVDGCYETGIQEHWYSEPHGAIVSVDEDIVIQTATEDGEHVKESVALVLGIPTARISVEYADLGIHLGGKLWYPSVISALAALAASITGKKVKLLLTRQEDYLYSPKRAPATIKIKSVLSGAQIIETEVDMKIGLGAYAVQSERILQSAEDVLTGIYKVGRLKVKSSAVKYTVPPTGPFAGAGSSLVSFALERHISKICDLLGEEGSAWRGARFRAKLRARFETDDAQSVQGAPGGANASILRSITKVSDYKRKWGAYELLRKNGAAEKEAERILPQRGIGLAVSLTEGGAAGTEKIQSNPIAAAVIEIEVDRINYKAQVRGIWLHVSSYPLENPARAKQILRRACIAALGWVSTEKIKYTDGKITPELCAFYQILPVSETPAISIEFIEETDKTDKANSPQGTFWQDESLESLPFGVIPAAYTQAITQAVNHHFERVPITGQDIWRVIGILKQGEMK